MHNNEQEYLVQKIRTQYTEKEHTELESLQALDRKVKRPVNILSYTLGTIGALVMGAGMSLLMTDIGQTIGLAAPTAPGLLLGLLGMGVAILNYPLHRAYLRARRKKYAGQIIALSDALLDF